MLVPHPRTQPKSQGGSHHTTCRVPVLHRSCPAALHGRPVACMVPSRPGPSFSFAVKTFCSLLHSFVYKRHVVLLAPQATPLSHHCHRSLELAPLRTPTASLESQSPLNTPPQPPKHHIALHPPSPHQNQSRGRSATSASPATITGAVSKLVSASNRPTVRIHCTLGCGPASPAAPSPAASSPEPPGPLCRD